MKKIVSILLIAILAFSINVPVYATVNDTGFADVDHDAWYANAVIYCRDNKLMGGTTTTDFEPNTSMTRAMLVSTLYRMAGSPQVNANNPFSDVTAGNGYANAILWAQQNNIVSGYDNGQFGVDDPVSREQMAAMLWRYAKSPQAARTADFSDQVSISSWALEAVDWTHDNHIMNGKDGNRFDPQGNVTRAEAAAVLMNYSQDRRPDVQLEMAANSEEGNKILIAFFSLEGNTKADDDVDASTSASVVVDDGEQMGITERMARMIQDQVGGDIHFIETKDAYPSDFDDVVVQNHQESSAGARPELSSAVDVGDYEVIFIGYPVWASSVPTPVLSFLEGTDFAGKTVIPFCTHDGYGAGSSYSAIARASEGAIVEQGLAIEATGIGSAQQIVETWLDGLNLPDSITQSHFQQPQTETPITLAIGDITLDGVLYDTPMAQALINRLPSTITMGTYGDREYYGGAGEEIAAVGEGQLWFSNGDITYCPSNNTLAVFYAQTDRPHLTMEVYPIGKVTSDLAVFDTFGSSMTITFERANGEG